MNVVESVKAKDKLSFKVFVVGYTGETGKALLKILADDSRFKEIVLFGRRTVELNIGENSEKCVQKLVDFDKLDEQKESFFDNFDAGFCCLGTTRGKSGKEGFIKVDHDYVVKVAELARNGECKQFHLVSSAGANSKSFFLINKIKGLVEEEVTNLKYPMLSIYRPKVLMGHREEKRYFEIVLKALLKPISYMSPTLLTTPFEILAKAIVNNFIKGHTKLESSGDLGGSSTVIDNNLIFQLAYESI